MGSPTCLSCPFCLDTDFDLVGLKLHLTQGDCDEYVRTALPTRTGRPTPPAPADARPMVVGGAFVKFDRPTPADDARIYPCADCGLMRSRSEGGTTFTVCDVCWDKAYPTAPAPDAGAAEDHPTASSLDARRDHGAEGSDRAVVEAALRWFANSRTERDCVDEYHTTFREADEQDLYDAAERLAALRGTKGGHRG